MFALSAVTLPHRAFPQGTEAWWAPPRPCSRRSRSGSRSTRSHVRSAPAPSPTPAAEPPPPSWRRAKLSLVRESYQESDFIFSTFMFHLNFQFKRTFSRYLVKIV